MSHARVAFRTQSSTPRAPSPSSRAPVAAPSAKTSASSIVSRLPRFPPLVSPSLPPSLRAPSVPLSFLSVHPTFRVDPDFRVSVPTAASVLPRSLAEEVAHSTAAAHAPNRFQTGKSFSGRQITAQVPSCSFSLFELVHSSVFWDLVILYHL